MIETEIRSVQFAEVDWGDASCLISYGPLPEKLVLSVQAVGLLQMPLLRQKENGLLQIVCGSRRLSVCRELGLEPVDCQVLVGSLSVETCLRLAVYDNLAQRILNPVEKGLALAKLAHCLSESQLLDEIMPLLDLERSTMLLDRYKKLPLLEPDILTALASGKLHERLAFGLATLEPRDRLAFASLFAELPYSVSNQEELLELVTEIAQRDKLTIPQVIQGAKEIALAEAHHRPQRQQAQALRTYMQARRAPRLTARKERFAKEVKELGLPAGVRLLPPPSFEGPQWRLECSFKRGDELVEMLRQTARLAEKPSFERVMASG
jgi:ParB family chromosome partitioning protein